VPNEVSIKITADNQSSGGFKAASSEAKEYGNSIDSATEKADVGEQRITGLNDTISGTAAIMAGPGKDGIGAYLQGWADLASGLANAVIPAIGQVATAEGRAAIATSLSTAKQKIAAVATKAYAVAQRVLNAAMRANPIGIIITLLVLLVGGLILAYKKSDTFRAIVQTAFKAVKAAATVMWTGLKAAFGAIAGVLSNAGQRFRQFWNVSRAAIQALISFARSVPGRIRGAFGQLYGIITNPVRNAVNAVKSWLNGLLSFAKSIPSRIGNSIKGAIPGFAHGGVTGSANGASPSGLTMTGEHGPELLQLPPGTRVRSNPDTRRAMSGAGGGGVQVVKIILDGTGLLKNIRGTIREQGGNVQVVLGP